MTVGIIVGEVRVASLGGASFELINRSQTKITEFLSKSVTADACSLFQSPLFQNLRPTRIKPAFKGDESSIPFSHLRSLKILDTAIRLDWWCLAHTDSVERRKLISIAE